MNAFKLLQIAVLMSVLAGSAAACGQPKPGREAGTFGAAAEPSPAASEVKASPTPSADAKPSPETAAVNSPAPSAASQGVDGSPAPQSTSTSAVSNASDSTKEPEPAKPAAAAPKSTAENSKPPAPEKKPESANSGMPILSWSEFFDDDKQNRPSERFWNLSEQRATVEIKGFMGEVLSFDKHWFLLIPQPGAECPFDNGDETYWNKIMIVFVTGNTNLRYTPGPLKITGRLDVGIKVDESGYKTMFRLYDAKFEKIKE